MDSEKKFWERVYELKGDKTLQELCDHTGLSKATLASTKSRNKLPNLADADKIAKYLNTTIDYLLNGETDQFTPLEREFIGKFRDSPRNIKTLIEQVVGSTININN